MIGQSLGRYVIESKLGEGGMGIVFKARDAQLGRSVAIKILPPDSVADPEKKRRFVQEAKAASALNHPHIVTIHDIGSDGGTDFIVMELLGGTTLAEALPAHGLPLRQALTYAIEIADALARAHEAGIIHRDLKPANVMITETGSVKILDFGMAKLLESVEPSASTTIAAATEQGITVGTPNYMSPEQAEGRKLDSRSDIFSFGAVLYEMVTGRPAFSGGSSLSVLAKILNEEPTPPSRIVTTLPPDVEKSILRCLRKDPARRYQTMADLKVALEDLVIESSAAIPAQVPVRTPTPLRRWAWVPLLAMVVIAAGFAGTRWWRASLAGEPTQAVPLTSLSGFVRYPSLSPDGNHVVFTWTGVTRDNPDLYVQQVGAGSHIRLTTDPGNDFSPSWSPDGRLIAFLRRAPGSLTSELRTIPPLGGTERKVADIAPATAVYRPQSVSWCPDSTCLLATDSPGDGTPDAVFVIALDSGEKRQLTHPRLTTSGQAMMADVDPAVSPDGRSLIFRRDTTPFTGEFHRLALTGKVMADGEPVRLTPSVLAGKAVWMPDSREILFSERGALWRLDTASGGTPTRLPFVGQDGTGPIVSRTPDGRQRLVYVRSFSDGNIWRVDLPAAGAPALSPPVAAIATPRFENLPSLSADGSRLAFMSNRSGEYRGVGGRAGWIERDSADHAGARSRLPALVAGRHADRVPQRSERAGRRPDGAGGRRPAAGADERGAERRISDVLPRRAVALLQRGQQSREPESGRCRWPAARPCRSRRVPDRSPWSRAMAAACSTSRRGIGRARCGACRCPAAPRSSCWTRRCSARSTSSRAGSITSIACRENRAATTRSGRWARRGCVTTISPLGNRQPSCPTLARSTAG